MNHDRDIKRFFAKYTPIPKLKLYARYQDIRKGEAGSIVEQYLAEPQPAFLNNYQKNRKDLFLQANYEWLHNVYLRTSAQWMKEDYTNGLKTNNTSYTVGISFGLP